MANAGELVIKQKLDNTEFKSKLEETEKSVEKFSHNVKHLLAMVGVGALFHSAIEGAIESQQALAHFENAMRGAGNATEEQIKSFREFAELAVKNFGIDDEAILGAVASLAQLTGSAAAVDILKQSLVDMAVATGNSVDNVSSILARTMAIGLTSLRRYGIVATEEQQKMWDSFGNDMEAKAKFLNDLLQNKFGGAAEAFGQTAAGRLAAAKEELQNFKDELGMQLLPVLTALVNVFNTLAKIFGGLPGLIGAVGAALLAYRLISMATMTQEEIKSLSLIGRYMALGMAKLWSINPLLAVVGGLAMAGAIVGSIFGLMSLFGGSSGGGSAPSNSSADNNSTDKSNQETDVKIEVKQNEFGQWVATQVKRNGVSDNVNY